MIWLIPCVSYFLGEILLAYEQSDLDQLAKTRKCIGCDFRDADFSMGNLLNPILGISELLGSEQRRENFLGALLEGADLLINPANKTLNYDIKSLYCEHGKNRYQATL